MKFLSTTPAPFYALAELFHPKQSVALGKRYPAGGFAFFESKRKI